MGKINTARVILGGLLAGLVINIGEFILNAVLLEEQMTEALRKLNLEPVGGQAIMWFVLMGFALGIVTVWLYAAVRPRFGAGARTAVITGLVIWLLFYVGPSLGYGIMGFFPSGLLWIGVIWGLFEIPIAAVIGAWPYKEE